jgi:O-antigen/teichoic acid export membrane protein
MGKTIPVMRLLATGLRMGAMGIKLIGLIGLARFVEPAVYSRFAFVTVFAVFSGFLIGAELYTRTIFKLSALSVERWSPFVSRQYSAILRILVLFWIGALGFYLFDHSDGAMGLWIGAIATAEVLNQENNRILIISRNHGFASSMLFLRQCVWLLATFLFLETGILPTPTDAVLGAWLLAAALTGVCGFIRLERFGLRIRLVPVPWSLFVRLIRASSLILMSGLSMHGLLSLDKIVLGLTDTYHMLPAYSFFAALAFALIPILDNAVFVYLMPDLVRARATNDSGRFRSLMTQTALLVGGMVVAYAGGLTIFANLVVGWVGKPYYAANMTVFYLLLAAVSFYAMAMTCYYGIYGLRHNRVLFYAHGAAVVICQGIYGLLHLLGQPLAMPVALLCSMAVLCLVEASAFLWLFRRSRTGEWGARSSPQHDEYSREILPAERG